MIYFITKAEKNYTLLSFRNTWGKSLKGKVKVLPLEKLVRQKQINTGTYILTDYDLLSKEQSSFIEKIYQELTKYPKSFKLINQPGVSLNRLLFLKKLFEKKINGFRCFSCLETPDDIQFPVFVRNGSDHKGKISELIYKLEELEKYVEKISLAGTKREEILITEFVDTSNTEKIFKKYSTFYLDGKVIPRHIFFSKHWMIKNPDLADDTFIQEELIYLQSNPHEDKIREIFKIARIDYGRIDYSLKGNKIVVWEINPNPMIASSSSLKKHHRRKAHELFVKNMVEAMQDLNIIKGGAPIPNPLLTGTYSVKQQIKKLFPFNSLVYLGLSFYQNFKFVVLYKFYSIRNRLR